MKSVLLATALIATPLVALTTLPAIADGHGAKPDPVTVEMKDASGEVLGTVTLTQMHETVLLHVDLEGVPEGGHGFHVHETGACEPDFKAAGDHYAPYGKGHGFMSENAPHAADMANVFAASDGTVKADVFNPRISLTTDVAHTVFDEDGSALILHAKPDSYGDEPGAGERIACGVIE